MIKNQSKDKSTLESKSREIFHDLHKKQSLDPFDLKRLQDRLSTSFLKVEKNFFEDKNCIDVGCGSNFNGTISMLSHGAKHVTAVDLDSSILEISNEMLSNFDKTRYEIKFSNVLELNFNDNSFDFTHCVGVLHHTKSVYIGLKELVRITKPGGLIFIETYGYGGLIRDIATMLRKKYKKDVDFKKLIDGLTPKNFMEVFNFLNMSMQQKNDNFFKNVDKKVISKLFDDSLILTIKDIITSPVYHENSEEELRSFFKEFNCKNVERLTRYPEFKNIRRILSPFYDSYDNEFSRLLYGDGNIKLKAIKV